MAMFLCVPMIGEKNILGDFNKQSLREIWTSEKVKVQENLYSMQRNFSPCNVCDAEGD